LEKLLKRLRRHGRIVALPLDFPVLGC
jgi:hypothetical protein